MPPAWWQRALTNLLGDVAGYVVENAVRGGVERCFTRQEFLEGARDAYWAVQTLLADAEWGNLDRAVTPRLLHAMRATAQEYGAAGLKWRVELPTDIDARLIGMTFWLPDEARGVMVGDPNGAEDGAAAATKGAEDGAAAGAKGAEDGAAAGASAASAHGTPEDAASRNAGTSGGAAYDGARSSTYSFPPRPEAAMPAGMYLVLSVQFQCRQRVVITRVDGGQEVADFEDVRPTRWRFVRGPLPRGCPVEELEDLPWVLADI